MKLLLECNHVVEFPKNTGIGSWKKNHLWCKTPKNRPNCVLEVREFLKKPLGMCPCCGIPKDLLLECVDGAEFLKPPELCLESEKNS